MVRIGEIEFFTKINHASKDYLNRLASIVEDSCLVGLNRKQDRFQLIDSLYALYYKKPNKVHENSFTPSNHKNRFDFVVHLSCPFSELSIYKIPYSILADTFGYGVKFERARAVERVNGVTNSEYGTEILYRIIRFFKELNAKTGLFGETLDSGKSLILYEVSNWIEGKPIFK